MTTSLTIQERAKIEARYEVRNFIVLVQKWWGACKDRHKTRRPGTIRNCRAKLMTAGSVNDRRKERAFIHKSISEEGENSAGNLMRILQKSTHQAARNSGLTRHTILYVLHKELNYHV